MFQNGGARQGEEGPREGPRKHTSQLGIEKGKKLKAIIVIDLAFYTRLFDVNAFWGSLTPGTITSRCQRRSVLPFLGS